MSIGSATPPPEPPSRHEPPSAPGKDVLSDEISALSKNISSLFVKAHAKTSKEPAPLEQSFSITQSIIGIGQFFMELFSTQLLTYLDSLRNPLTSTQQENLKTSDELNQLLENDGFDVTKYSEEEKENIFNNLIYSFSKKPDLAIQEPVIKLVEALMPNKRGHPDEQMIFMRYACLVLNMPEGSKRKEELLNCLPEGFFTSNVDDQLTAMTQAPTLNLTQMRLFEALLKTDQANEAHFTSYSNALKFLCYREQEGSTEDERAQLIANFASIVTSNTIISPASKINYLGAMYSVATSASELPHSSKFLPAYTDSLTRDPILTFIKEQSENIDDLLAREPLEDRDRLLANMNLLKTALPITIKGPAGENFEVSLPSGGTVADLRAAVAKEQGKPLYCIELYIAGEEDKLKDTLRLRDSSIQAATEVFMLTKPEFTEKEALMALYNACGGPTWNNTTNWDSDRPLSDWYGVTLGIDGKVSALNLRGRNLTGPLPPEIGALTSLEHLDLDANQLSGAIPPEIGALTSLKGLDLSHNRLSGEIPRGIGALTSLKDLLLFHNNLSGAIPPEIGALTALKELRMSNNQLNGAIPPEIGALTSLKRLDLSHNILRGAIPETIGALTALQGLDLSHNRLSGEIPREIGALTAVWTLILRHNELSGAIPPEISALTSLKRLDLSHNILRGAIPETIGDLTAMTYLFLSYNQLSGAIPQDVCDLAAFKVDDVAPGNQLTLT